MKAHTYLGLGLGLGLLGLGQLAASDPPPEVEMVFVEKYHYFLQTGDGATMQRPTDPFQFRVFIEGNDLLGLSSGVFTRPSGIPVDPNLVPGSSEWSYRADFSTQAEMDVSFGSGTYTITAGALTFSLNHLAIAFPNVPLLNFGPGGTWAGNNMPILYWDVSQPLTFTSNTFGGYTTNGFLNHISVNLNTDNEDLLNLRSFSDSNVMFFDSEKDVTTDSLSLSSYSLVSGQTYYLNIEFITVVDMETLGDATGLAYYSTLTQLQIHAIPEPAGAAWWLAMVALAGAGLRRRRRD
jgi:MYXO-CTERM domain-containing protein